MERVVHVHNKWVFELGEDLTLVDHRLDTALGDDARLAHLLHGKVLLLLLALDSPYFAKTTLADAKVIHEVCL